MIDIRKRIPRHKTKIWKQRKVVDTIVVHTTGSLNQDPMKTALYHIEPNHISKTGCPSICYADYITGNGTIYHCNNYSDITWHAGLYNTRSIGVVLAFEGQTGEPPPDDQYDSLIDHLVFLCLNFNIHPSRVIGHREVPGMFTLLGNGSKKYKKVCPGMGIDLDLLRQRLSIFLQYKLYNLELYRGPLDGKFGPASTKALSLYKDSVGLR